MTGGLSIRRKDLHDQFQRSSGNGCRQRDAQDRPRLIGHVYRGGGYLREAPAGEGSVRSFIQADGDGLSRVGAGVGRFDSEGNGGDVVLPRTGEGCHVESAPVAAVKMGESSRSSPVTRARVARQNRLAGGMGQDRRTRLCPGLSGENREDGAGDKKSRGKPGRKKGRSIEHGVRSFRAKTGPCFGVRAPIFFGGNYRGMTILLRQPPSPRLWRSSGYGGQDDEWGELNRGSSYAEATADRLRGWHG